MTDLDQRSAAPEFHLVVKRPNERGPLAPYRMTLAVLFAMWIAGQRLWDAAQTGIGVDRALLLAGVSALFIWIISGVINNILKSAAPPPRSIAAKS